MAPGASRGPGTDKTLEFLLQMALTHCHDVVAQI